jgi:hypothetical protein
MRPLLLGLALMLVGCKRPPVFSATGLVTAAPQHLPELDVRAVMIKHDGLHFTEDGRAVDLVPLRTPFQISWGLDTSALKPGARIAFTYKLKQSGFLGPNLSFELMEAHGLPAGAHQ